MNLGNQILGLKNQGVVNRVDADQRLNDQFKAASGYRAPPEFFSHITHGQIDNRHGRINANFDTGELRYVEDNPMMAEIQKILGPFMQMFQDRSKPVQSDLFGAQGFHVSGATQEELGRLMQGPVEVPPAEKIPGLIANIDPSTEKFKHEFRTFIENVPVKYVNELRHPTHFMEGVPKDPMINMINLDAQRRRVESVYAFI